MDNTYGAPGVNPKEAVSVPAILLMVIAGLGIAMGLLGLVGGGSSDMVMRLAESLNLPEDQRAVFEQASQQGSNRLSNLPLLILSGFMFFGALKMKNLESYGLAMAAAIIACIPCCGSCCCIGIPVGIWSLVVLRKPEVKAAFR